MSDLEMPEPGAEGEVQTPYQPSDVFPNEDSKQQCLEYVCSEILDVRDGQDRAGLQERWEKWRRQRRAIPEQKTRDTPWINAANVEPPLTQQKVLTIWAKEVGAFSNQKPPCTVASLSKDTINEAKASALQKFMNHTMLHRYGMDWNRNWPLVMFDQVSMGTEFVKVPFLVEQWSFKRVNPQTGNAENITYTKHQGPALIRVRLEDLFTRPHWKDLETAPWVGVRTRLFAHELRQKAALGIFDAEAVEKVLGDNLTTYDDNAMSELARSGIDSPTISADPANSEYEIYEVNVFWDVDGTGIPVDLVLFLEPSSRTLLRSQFNPLSVRDIEPVLYLENPEVLYGIGVAELAEQGQDEVSALHRMRLDGTSLAMQKNFAVRKGAGIGPNETIMPQKIWQLDDPATDLKVIDFPDIASSCILGEQIAKDYTDRVTGASDYMAGFNDSTVGTSATASGTIFLANQANSILSAILARAQQSATNIMMKVLYQCIANRDLVDLTWMEPEDAAFVAEVLSSDVANLPTTFQFNVQITDLMKTDEARKQNVLAVNQVYTQYSQQMMQLAMMLANPQAAANPILGELAQSLYVGFSKFMTKLLEFFDVGDPDDYLPYTKDREFMLSIQDKMRDQQVAQMKGALSNAQQAGTVTGSGGIGGSPSGNLGGNPPGGAAASMAPGFGGGPGGFPPGAAGGGGGFNEGLPPSGSGPGM